MRRCIDADPSNPRQNEVMTCHDVLERLKALGSEKVRRQTARKDAGDQQYGVLSGDMRKIAKEIKTDHALALELWKTDNLDAMMLSTLIIKPKELTAQELDQMVHDMKWAYLADWVSSYVVKVHPDNEALREKWMTSDHPMCARMAWSLTADKISKEPSSLDLDALLDRIEREMGHAHELPQWTMNFALAAIGINSPAHRDRAIAIGEKLGVYRDYPTPKGCTSPFAPIWISEMVRRQTA